MVSPSTFFWWNQQQPNEGGKWLFVVYFSCRSDSRKKKLVRSWDGVFGGEVDVVFIQTLLYTLQDYKATSEAFTTAFNLPDFWTSLKGGSDLHFSQRDNGSFKISSKYCIRNFEASSATQRYCTACSKAKKSSKKWTVPIKQRQKTL